MYQFVFAPFSFQRNLIFPGKIKERLKEKRKLESATENFLLNLRLNFNYRIFQMILFIQKYPSLETELLYKYTSRKTLKSVRYLAHLLFQALNSSVKKVFSRILRTWSFAVSFSLSIIFFVLISRIDIPESSSRQEKLMKNHAEFIIFQNLDLVFSFPCDERNQPLYI